MSVIKVPLIVLLLKLGVYICLAMSLMMFIERLYMDVVIMLVKALHETLYTFFLFPFVGFYLLSTSVVVVLSFWFSYSVCVLCD